MVKWKKLNKKMAGALLAVTMLFTVSTTTFAYVDESAEASRTETTQTEQAADQEQTAPAEDTAAENTDAEKTGSAFSTPGNGEVKDDITDSSTKEFLTVTTKNNNTFYIVIDRSATSQNVYMLSQIDEKDLSEFLDKDSTATVITPQEDASSKVVLDETDTTEDDAKDTSADTKEKASAKTNPGAMAAVLLLALGGVGAYYYFKIYKPKKEAEEDDVSEGLEMDDLESLPEEEVSENDDDFEDTDE